MPFSGGVFSIINTFIPGTTILSASVNANFSDIATGLSDCLTRDNQAGMTGALRLIDGAAATPSLTFNSETGLGLRRKSAGILGIEGLGADVMAIDANQIGVTGNALTQAPSGAVLMPVGSILDFAGTAAPAGWLLCFGQSLVRATYPELFAAISTTYGAVDGTHFSLPDCRGRGRFGQDNMGGSAANRITSAGSGITGTTLGAAGGGQNITLLRTDLPNVAPTASFAGTPVTPTTASVTGGPFNTGNGGQTTAGGGGFSNTGNANPTITMNAITPAGSVTVQSLNGNVTQTLPQTMNPAIIFNTIIFAAR